MKKETVSFKETRNFSKKFLNFIENESLSYYPKEENILETLKGLNFSKGDVVCWFHDDLQFHPSEALKTYSETKDKLNNHNILLKNSYLLNLL